MSTSNETGRESDLEAVTKFLAEGDPNVTPLWRVAQAVYGEAWAITPEVFFTICQVVRQRIEGRGSSPEGLELAARSREAYAVRAAHNAETSAATSVAVLPLFGVLGHRMNLMMAMSGGTSTEKFGRAFQSAIRDESIGAIIIDTMAGGDSLGNVWIYIVGPVLGALGAVPIFRLQNPEDAPE